MSDLVVTNWFGDVVSHPNAIVEANSVKDIITVLKNPLSIHPLNDYFQSLPSAGMAATSA